MNARRQWQSLGEVVLCSGFPTQLVLSGLAGLAGITPVDGAGRLSLPFLVLVSAADTVLLLALVGWFLAARGESPRHVLLGQRPTHAEARLGTALAPAVIAFMIFGIWGVRHALPALPTLEQNPFGALAQSPSGAVLVLVVAIVAGGLREEVQRGFLLHRFTGDLGGPAGGLLIPSAVFGLGHLVQGWDAVIVTGLLGAFWGLLFLRRRSVVAAVVSHALANGAQVLIAFLAGAGGGVAVGG